MRRRRDVPERDELADRPRHRLVAYLLGGGEIAGRLRPLAIEESQHGQLAERDGALRPHAADKLADGKPQVARGACGGRATHTAELYSLAVEFSSMPVDSLLPESALVLIDLQRGVTALPLVQPTSDVLANAGRLATEFRARRLPVALVRVTWSPDGGDVLRTRVDAQPPAMDLGPDFATLNPELGDAPGDIHITKRGWDAFFGTELDLQLRRRGIHSIVLGGVRTSIGVESTARTGYLLGYEVVIPSDACGDISEPVHRNSLEQIFPRLGRVDTTDQILAAL
jgi:nicotinamidase-related amidase